MFQKIIVWLLSVSAASAASTFFRDAVTDHRFAFLCVIVHDESDESAAGSMISET